MEFTCYDKLLMEELPTTDDEYDTIETKAVISGDKNTNTQRNSNSNPLLLAKNSNSVEKAMLLKSNVCIYIYSIIFKFLYICIYSNMEVMMNYIVIIIMIQVCIYHRI